MKEMNLFVVFVRFFVIIMYIKVVIVIIIMITIYPQLVFRKGSERSVLQLFSFLIFCVKNFSNGLERHF